MGPLINISYSFFKLITNDMKRMKGIELVVIIAAISMGACAIVSILGIAIHNKVIEGIGIIGMTVCFLIVGACMAIEA